MRFLVINNNLAFDRRANYIPFLALRIRPNRCASCLLDPPWDEIWIKTLASGKSKEVSATLLTNIVFTFILNLKFCKMCILSL